MGLYMLFLQSYIAHQSLNTFPILHFYTKVYINDTERYITYMIVWYVYRRPFIIKLIIVISDWWYESNLHVENIWRTFQYNQSTFSTGSLQKHVSYLPLSF